METDWQSTKSSLKDRNEHLLTTGYEADCFFQIKETKFSAHKIILYSASPVFESMFFGEQPIKLDQPIEIGDIEEEDFKDFLYFIYCCEANLDSVDKATKLYYAAKKYKIKELIKKCITFLSEKAKTENACEIYKFAKQHEEQDLLNKVIEIIKANPCKAISDSIQRVDISAVIDILEQKTLKGSEMDLFNTLKNLAIKQGVIPATLDQKFAKSLENSKLEIFQTLERLEKTQRIFIEITNVETAASSNETSKESAAESPTSSNQTNATFVVKASEPIKPTNVDTNSDIITQSNDTNPETPTSSDEISDSVSMEEVDNFHLIKKCFNITKEQLFRIQYEFSELEKIINENEPSTTEKILITKQNAKIINEFCNTDEDYALYKKFRIAVKKIEFLAFTADNFFNHASNTGLLLPEESLAILGCILYKPKIQSHYPNDFTKGFRTVAPKQ